MFQRVTQDEDMKISFNCCWSSLNHGLSLNNIAPSWSEHAHSSVYNQMAFVNARNDFDGLWWLIMWFFLCPQLIWIPFVFSSQSPLYCSQLLNFSRSVEDFNLIYQGFRRLNQCSFVFDNLPCSGINSHISKIMSIQSLVCWNEIWDVLFLKNLLKIKLFD